MVSLKKQVVILAAGSSTRAKTDKQFFKLGDKYLIEFTIERFRKAGIDDIVLVLSDENIKKYSQIFDEIKIVCGGKTRIQSFLNGSRLIARDTDIILVHDGARPFVSQTLINKLIEKAYEYGASIPAIKLKDTVKEVGENNIVMRTLKRENLRAVQTPQVYRKDIFELLVKNIDDIEITDDSQIIEKLGKSVYVVEGEETNIKITTPLDLQIAEVIYEKMQL